MDHGPEPASPAARARRGPERAQELREQAAEVLRRGIAVVGPGEDLDGTPATDLRTLDGQLAILGGQMRERLGDPEAELDWATVAETSRALHRLHTVRFAIHDHLAHERVRRLDTLDAGLSALRRLASQDELLEVVCESAATSCGFERVMLSRVEGSTWIPWRSYARTVGDVERRFIDWMREMPRIELGAMVLESDLLRTREPAIVRDAASDPRVHAELRRVAHQVSYVAAPVVAGERVIGLLHADHVDRLVTERDLEILWFFAISFGEIFERVVLLDRLQEQREGVLTMMHSVEAMLDELASLEVDLVRRPGPSVLGAGRPARSATRSPTAIEALVTPRELEVLELMATGATNERIAQQLVVATDTVKSHVKQVLRKLRVENRAEAISYYLRLTVGVRDD